MDDVNEVRDALLVEIRRGIITLSVLSQLQKPQYGYALLRNLDERSAGIEAGTLYPLLRRLEAQGLLKSEWDTSDARPRRYYALSENGRELYRLLKGEWAKLSEQMKRLFAEDESDEPN